MWRQAAKSEIVAPPTPRASSAVMEEGLPAWRLRSGLGSRAGDSGLAASVATSATKTVVNAAIRQQIDVSFDSAATPHDISIAPVPSSAPPPRPVVPPVVLLPVSSTEINRSAGDTLPRVAPMAWPPKPSQPEYPLCHAGDIDFGVHRVRLKDASGGELLLRALRAERDANDQREVARAATVANAELRRALIDAQRRLESRSRADEMLARANEQALEAAKRAAAAESKALRLETALAAAEGRLAGVEETIRESKKHGTESTIHGRSVIAATEDECDLLGECWALSVFVDAATRAVVGAMSSRQVAADATLVSSLERLASGLQETECQMQARLVCSSSKSAMTAIRDRLRSSEKFAIRLVNARLAAISSVDWVAEPAVNVKRCVSPPTEPQRAESAIVGGTPSVVPRREDSRAASVGGDVAAVAPDTDANQSELVGSAMPLEHSPMPRKTASVHRQSSPVSSAYFAARPAPPRLRSSDSRDPAVFADEADDHDVAPPGAARSRAEDDRCKVQ